MKIYREITPLKPQDVFGLFNYPEAEFDYPLHNHPEYEINLIMRASGTRIVGDKVEKYQDWDLVLLGPYLNHTWDGSDTNKQQYPTTHTIVLQFEEHLFQTALLSKEAFQSIKRMLDFSVRGIEFYGETRTKATDKLMRLTELQGFEAAICFLEILQYLSISEENRLIASAGFAAKNKVPGSAKIDKVYDYLRKNYQNKISIKQVADIANMSESAFSHFFKKSTNRNFTTFLMELRLGEACRRLLNTQESVSEICFNCGYTNLSNFNRLFKKYKGMTPVAFRQQVSYHQSTIAKRFT